MTSSSDVYPYKNGTGSSPLESTLNKHYCGRKFKKQQYTRGSLETQRKLEREAKTQRLSRCRSSLRGAAASCRSEGRYTPV